MVSPLLHCKILLLLSLGCATGIGVAFCTANNNDDGDYGQCESKVKTWAANALQELEGRNDQDRQKLQDLLFFLHIPRTGGRTYFYCFLRKLYTNNQECPHSYDKLRFDPSKPNCRLMVTHDDYSILSRLPKERTSVVTILRNPVDRVFSIYEFTIELAARFLVHPKLASSMHRIRNMNSRSGVVSTLDIWPWKYLVPWMHEDLLARRKSRRLDTLVIPNEVEDSYNLSAIMMPFYEFIHHPLSHDFIHNGATFQVAGLTDNSHLEGAREIRQCVAKYKKFEQHVLKVVKRRLDEMLYVGLTENHKESAAMFVKMVEAQILSQQHLNKSVGTASFHIDEIKGSNFSLSCTRCKDNIQTQVTFKKLMESYEECISTLWGSQSARRISSLSGVTPANFSKEARSHVHKFVINEIKTLNNLDVEMYKHAQNIFAQQQSSLSQEQSYFWHQSKIEHTNMSHKFVGKSRATVKNNIEKQSQQVTVMENEGQASGCFLRNGFLELITVLPMIFILLLLVQRRTSKPNV